MKSVRRLNPGSDALELRRLASFLCKAEGKKSQVKIGDMREVIRIISETLYHNPRLALVLIASGQRSWQARMNKKIARMGKKK